MSGKGNMFVIFLFGRDAHLLGSPGACWEFLGHLAVPFEFKVSDFFMDLFLVFSCDASITRTFFV